MTDLKFLETYQGQSLDDLIALEDTHRIDSIVLAIEAALEAKAERGALSDAERVVLAVEALEREVNNGGYDQFFLNSSKAYAADIEAALRAIGCPQQSDIAKRALAALGIAGDITPKAIEGAQAAGGEALVACLGELDGEFYACSEPIADRLFAFVKENRSKIQLQG
jgi:hypothetical protein